MIKKYVPKSDIDELDPVDATIVKAQVDYLNEHNVDIDEHNWPGEEVLDYVSRRVNEECGGVEASKYVRDQGYRGSWAASALGHYIDWSSEWVSDYVERGGEVDD